ncbi:MarC family protein [Swaminathania salitolerans]|uniref:UPF0056 membrane protein n=1 Tax=Swaminathania salitolerans TaxID=182838 RepID=A0A511BNW2_9PROT|nr:MarC family protein [Swaminathania salitolerans]GBQ15912.1 multiple antibiotic resistance protein MarC [Swaminathania salitolerans LMG 21291]GEL01533.1 UPF0056 inner membrane protein [Swaminathania salitolerans]
MQLPQVLAHPVVFRDVVGIWLMAYSALFSILNPIGASLIFAQATMDAPRRDILVLARNVGLYGFMILIVSIWFGGWILSFFGISIDALRVSGGLVVASWAWSLLLAPEESEARKQRQVLDHKRESPRSELADRAFFPLTMPFTVGPGGIAVAIALSSGGTLGTSPGSFELGLLLAALSIAMTIVIVYSYADRIVTALGRTGARIVSRLAALILLCIGIQILFVGLQGFAVSVMRHIHEIS